MHADAIATREPRRDAARAQRRRVAAALLTAAVAVAALGLLAGSHGLSWRAFVADWEAGQGWLIVGEVRAPRSLGALLAGALLGLAGAIAQGLFRNPLADPYLLGSAAGASLGVVLVLAASALAGGPIPLAAASWLERLGLVSAAFAGALAGVTLTLLLARGAQHTIRLLLAGVVAAVLLGAVNDLITLAAPDALRGKQAFLLGSTAFVGWRGVALMAAGLAVALPLALAVARVLDALTLGEEVAESLGLSLARWRLALVTLFAFATALAVAQSGLIAFVGLAAPHVVRRLAPSSHGFLLAASALAGAVLLAAADVVARVVAAPQELPVGVITAVAGGAYLLWLLAREGRR